MDPAAAPISVSAARMPAALTISRATKATRRSIQVSGEPGFLRAARANVAISGGTERIVPASVSASIATGLVFLD